MVSASQVKDILRAFRNIKNSNTTGRELCFLITRFSRGTGANGEVGTCTDIKRLSDAIRLNLSIKGVSDQSLSIVDFYYFSVTE